MMTAYDSIEKGELIVLSLSNGQVIEGEVVGTDTHWISVCTRENNEVTCVQKAHIVSFRIRIT